MKWIISTTLLYFEKDHDDAVQSQRCFSGYWVHCTMGHLSLLLRSTRLIIPKGMCSRVLELAHKGHPGESAISRRLRNKVWPHNDRDAQKCCKNMQRPPRPRPCVYRQFFQVYGDKILTVNIIGINNRGHGRNILSLRFPKISADW